MRVYEEDKGLILAEEKDLSSDLCRIYHGFKHDSAPY